MNKTVFFALFGLFSVSAWAFPGSPGVLYAQQGAPPTILYDNCCDNTYGLCQHEITLAESPHVLHQYFLKRGLTAKITAHMGRFVKADIYKADSYIDTIILDRKTGKIRSIY